MRVCLGSALDMISSVLFIGFPELVGPPVTHHFMNNPEEIMNGSPVDLSPPRAPTLSTVHCLPPRSPSSDAETDAAHRSGSCYPVPAFGRTSVPPARRISLKGDNVGIGRPLPLREMASAAYGVGRHSVAETLAVGCPP